MAAGQQDQTAKQKTLEGPLQEEQKEDWIHLFGFSYCVLALLRDGTELIIQKPNRWKRKDTGKKCKNCFALWNSAVNIYIVVKNRLVSAVSYFEDLVVENGEG